MGAVDLVLGQVAEPVVDALDALHRRHRIPGDDQPGARAPRRRDRVVETAVGPDHAEEERRPVRVGR